jgi:hypothetical protein
MKYLQVTLDERARNPLQVRGLRDLEGEPVDEATLVRGLPCNAPRPLRYDAYVGGQLHDWNWGVFKLPYVRAEITEPLLDLVKDDVELIALEVDDVDEPLYIVNILSRRDCVDETRSLATRVTAADGWPEHVGQFKSLGFLTIDETRVSGANLFRIAGFEMGMVASQLFVDAVRRAAWIGIDFLPTYDGPPADFRPSGAQHPHQW